MMGWFGGNPNFNESTGKFIAEDSPDWRDPETGAYVNRPGVLSDKTGKPNNAMPNLGYASSQLAGTTPAGLEKQNLDYAMAQLGMMTGSSLGGGTTYPGTSTPGFDAPYGGATPDGGYNNPFTGADSAGRTPDDPYYGGLSDVGTADPNNWSYGNVNDYYNWGGEVVSGLFGPIGGAIGDAAFGINPTPGAGNYIPGTDTYIPTYLENFEGAGEKITDLYGIGTGEQRDQLIEQGFLGGEGMLGGQVADPDQQFFETKSEALNWYNNGVTVANPEDPGTAEAVGVANNMLSLEGSSFSSQEEAQAVANYGFGSDEHMAVIDSALTGFQTLTGNLEGVPEEEFNKQAQSALKAQQNLTAIMSSKQEEAQAAAKQNELDFMYNKYTDYTNEQLGTVTNDLTSQISQLNSQIDANQGKTTEDIASLSQLQDSLYDATNNKIDSLNAQILSGEVQTQEGLDALYSQLETTEGSLIEQINELYTGPYNNSNPYDFAPNDTITGDTGSWTNPAAGTDTSEAPSVDTISVHPETRLPTQPTPGVDGWTDPVSGNTFYNEDHNWNNPSQGPVAPNQTPVQAPAPDTSGSDDGGWGGTDTSEGTTAGDYSEAGFSQEDADFAQSFDDDSGSEDAADDGDWGDWGGGDNFGFE